MEQLDDALGAPAIELDRRRARSPRRDLPRSRPRTRGVRLVSEPPTRSRRGGPSPTSRPATAQLHVYRAGRRRSSAAGLRPWPRRQRPMLVASCGGTGGRCRPDHDRRAASWPLVESRTIVGLVAHRRPGGGRRRAGLDRPAFMGHSVGARTVAQFAATHPGRADRLVLDRPAVDGRPRNRRRPAGIRTRGDPRLVRLVRRHDRRTTWPHSGANSTPTGPTPSTPPGSSRNGRYNPTPPMTSRPSGGARWSPPSTVRRCSSTASPTRGGIVTDEVARRIVELNDRVTIAFVSTAPATTSIARTSTRSSTSYANSCSPGRPEAAATSSSVVPACVASTSAPSVGRTVIGTRPISMHSVSISRRTAASPGSRSSTRRRSSRAVRIFRRDGFVVVRDALDADQTAFLRAGVREVAQRDHRARRAIGSGNRGSHRYSFGGSSVTRSMLHRPEWQMLVDLPTVTPIITAIFESSDYLLRAASGDFCLPGAVEYQPLHCDMGDHVDDTRTPFSSFHDPAGSSRLVICRVRTSRSTSCPTIRPR